MGRGLVAGSLHCSHFQTRAHSEPPERFHPVPGEAGVWWDLKSLIFSILGDTDTPGACFENQVSNAGLQLKGITNLGTEVSKNIKILPVSHGMNRGIEMRAQTSMLASPRAVPSEKCWWQRRVHLY